MPSFNPYASVDKNKANSVIISGVENSSTASQAYSAGDYLILNDVLYRVTSDIASAGSIITSGSGTNVIITTVTDELQDKVSYGDVINNLTSTSIDKPLSANMGKALNEAIQQSTASAETKLSGQLSADVTGWADYIKFGKIVLVQFVLSNTAELSSGTRFITGIPKPDRIYTVGDYKFFNMNAYFRVGDDGSIITGNVIATNTNIRGSACYISA